MRTSCMIIIPDLAEKRTKDIDVTAIREGIRQAIRNVPIVLLPKLPALEPFVGSLLRQVNNTEYDHEVRFYESASNRPEPMPKHIVVMAVGVDVALLSPSWLLRAPRVHIWNGVSPHGYSFFRERILGESL